MNFVIKEELTSEDYAQREHELRKKLASGEQIDIEQCNMLLDSENDIALWKTISRIHLLYPNIPPVDLNATDDERTIEFWDMISRIINACVTYDDEWVRLSPVFIKDIISKTLNSNALFCISELTENDLVGPQDNYDRNLFYEIKRLAAERYKQFR